MIALVALSFLVAVSSASPSGLGYVQPVAVVQEHHKVIPGGQSTQYHSQGAYGNYAYGYSDPNSKKHEVGDYGSVKGSYSYIAPDGTPVVNEYYADKDGFRSNLAPTAPFDVHPQPDYTPVVAPVAHHATYSVAPVAHHASHTVAHHAAPAVTYGGTYASHAAPVAHHATHTVAYNAAPVTHYAAAPAIQQHVSYVSHPPVYARYAPSHTAYPVYGLY